MLTLATLETVTYGDSFPIFDIDIDVIDLAVDAIYFEVDAEIDAVGDVDFGLGIDFGVGDVNVGDAYGYISHFVGDDTDAVGVGGNAVGVVVDAVDLHVNVENGIGFALILALVFSIGDGGSVGVGVADFPAVFF